MCVSLHSVLWCHLQSLSWKVCPYASFAIHNHPDSEQIWIQMSSLLASISTYSDGAHSHWRRERGYFIGRRITPRHFNSQWGSAGEFFDTFLGGVGDHSCQVWWDSLTIFWDVWKQLSAIMSSSKSWSRRWTVMLMDKERNYENISRISHKTLSNKWT